VSSVGRPARCLTTIGTAKWRSALYDAAMFWKRTEPDRLPDARALTLLRGKIKQLAPEVAAGSVVRDGVLAGGRQPWAVRILPNHTDHPGHFDIGFSPSENEWVVDCISGFGTGADAFGTVLHLWAETSGACFLEMASGGTGDYAFHLRDGDSAGLPGWHTISSGVVGYGADDRSNHVLQEAMLDSEALRVLAPAVTPALDRSGINGIKVFLCRTPETVVAEVRVNGVPADDASEYLAGLDWPVVRDTAMVRFYAVAVHPS
jgi:hypothetical protein